METTVVSPQGDGGSAGLIIGLVLAAGIIAAVIFFGIPYLNNQQNQPQEQQPANINVTVPSPTPAPAPEPSPQP